MNPDFASMPEDGYTQLFPFGEFPGEAIESDGTTVRITQVLDPSAAKAILANITAEELIDYDHQSHDKNRATIAAGWLPTAAGAAIRNDGLYTRNRWSVSGRSDIEGGDYRYISPEFEELEPLGSDGPYGPRFRPHKISGAGLTNRPNLRNSKPLVRLAGEVIPLKGADLKVLNRAKAIQETRHTTFLTAWRQAEVELDSAAETAENRAVKVRNRALQIARIEGCGFVAAWNRAESEAT